MRCRAFIAAMGFVLAAAGSARADYSPKAGDRHPDFTLANIETGKPVSLSDFRGKKVLLIHFASW